MVDYMPAEKGVAIRMPSVANLFVDSSATSPFNFQISKKQALLNGFFTRLATTELVLEWSIPNIDLTGPLSTANQPGYLNNTQFDLEQSSVTYTATLPTGQYTVAEVLDCIVAQLSPSIPGLAVSSTAGSPVALIATSAFTVEAPANGSDLWARLGFVLSNSSTDQSVNAPDLRRFSYLDFCCSDLTYNQNVKDGTTTDEDRVVLARWYMSWDNPPLNDNYGFPILMGYQVMTLRRMFSPAKQIKWESNMPIGNLTFQVFSDQSQQPLPASIINNEASLNTRWLMTIQVSEV
jgi:hypothetical protein